MIILGILMILVIAALIGVLQNKEDESYSRDIEAKQKDLYDKLQGNPLVVRGLKARAETMIHSGMKEYHDIDYMPKDIREVTTLEERQARRRAEIFGRKYVHEWTKDQIEDVIKDMLETTGATRDELVVLLYHGAERMAQTYSRECAVNIEDARFVTLQIAAVLVEKRCR